MPSEFVKDRTVKLINRDQESLKRDLISFAQAHQSGSFQDFNESSPGMGMLELCSYVGGVLSFYQDMQFDELRQESARQLKNIVRNAKRMGYRPAGKRAARGQQVFYINVPAVNSGGQIVPDDTYTPVMRAGARVQGPNGAFFETLADVEFSASTQSDPRFVTGSRFDSSTGLPTFFAIKKFVDVVAGQTVTDTFVLGDFVKFRSLELSNEDVIEILSVTDSDGNKYYEVDYLAQEAVYDAVVNQDSDASVVPYQLKLVTVPRRFISDYNPTTRKTTMVFGSRDGVNFDDELVPNLADLSLPLAGRSTFTSFPLDPQNFLKTRSLGVSPFNTTVTVEYRVGGGPQTNVPANSVKSVAKAVLDFSTTGLVASTKGDVESSLVTNNLTSMEGGAPEESSDEIKMNSLAHFAAQNRTVTREDYMARVLTLPAKFGKPEKVFVKRSIGNALGVDVHLLTSDSEGHLALASVNLKKNVRTYLSRYRMLTDGVNILDSRIINLRCNFGVVLGPNSIRSKVLAKCIDVIREYLRVDRMQINQPIVLSHLSAEIQKVMGVVSVYELKFSNVVGVLEGSSYSTTRFDPSAHRRNEIMYCPENSIFEVKFPNKDIVGAAK